MSARTDRRERKSTGTRKDETIQHTPGAYLDAAQASPLPPPNAGIGALRYRQEEVIGDRQNGDRRRRPDGSRSDQGKDSYTSGNRKHVGSSLGGGGAVVYNQSDRSINGGGGGGDETYRKGPLTSSTTPRVINRVGLECLSPIKIGRTDTMASAAATPLHSAMSARSNATSAAHYQRDEMLTPSPPPNWLEYMRQQSLPWNERGDTEFKDELEKEGRPLSGTVAGSILPSSDVEEGEGEMGEGWVDVRPKRHLNYVTVTLTHILIGLALGVRGYDIIRDTLADRYYLRCLAFLYYPAAYVFMLFSIDYLLAQAIYALGPIAHMHTNSEYFSSVPCPRPEVLPRITVQMPVYKENLVETILPSIQSVMTAVLHYKKMGGEANLLICDDGLQLIPEKERNARLFTYKRHGVSFMARPHPSIRPRKGLFKKASNLNYTLNASLRVDEILAESSGQITDPEEALRMVSEEFSNEFLASGDIRMGDTILLVDSDTRVPEDCLSKISGEFERYPQVGFMQCRTASIRIHSNFWENMIAQFTNDVYSVGIAMAVSSGDPAPLVGHNAFIRWSAMREVSWVDAEDGERKFWSENHVSEDFDLALRLQANGYIGRYCTYMGDGFKEGVSLTAADEVIRLRKYAYGSCEIMLNQFKKWPCQGPITPMFRRYLGAKRVPAPAKIRMMAYLCTYIAMAFAIYGIAGYLAVWIMLPAALKFLVNPFDILITVSFVFGVCSVMGVSMITYRNGEASKASLFRSFWVQLVNAPIMLLFFSHVLWHLTVVCFRYFFSMDVEWSASVKEVDQKDFWTEVNSTFLRYKITFLCMIGLGGLFAAVMVLLDVEWDIRVYLPISIYIGSHVLGPFLLNPVIMRGYY